MVYLIFHDWGGLVGNDGNDGTVTYQNKNPRSVVLYRII